MSVNVEVPERDFPRPNRLAVVTVAFEPVDRPVFPLLDAAFIRGYINELGLAITDLASARIDEYRALVANGLESLLQCEVYYGSKLHTTPGYIACTELYNYDDNLQTGDEAFPHILLATDDVNFFPISDGSISDVLERVDNLQHIAADVCGKLEVDGIVIVNSRIRVASPDVILSKANVMLYTDLHVFGPNGDVLIQASVRSAAARSDPSQLSTYGEAISRFPDNLRILISELKKEMH